ncbi:plasmid mobilization relaxosome protein MobC [Kitasatospora sp. NA04385]|uniref:plasmid mobilization relaxosome protein MobC n=1 Tax=Kitasatospora sp. NA04385 TaxID=2742135 RepID=UPI001590C86D|nr:plasmid mobilization relaxosome protein MobC [Kitasatospora sp. NA04385]QKW20594.1 plasmid mobilization relaxosome protein MobC [Kitasatospora sp. NA04385]
MSIESIDYDDDEYTDERPVRRPRRRHHFPVQRKRFLTIRVSSDEQAAIRRAADERAVTVARFVASVALSAASRPDSSLDSTDQLDRAIDALSAARSEAARAGNNLNQIAHQLNSGGIPHPADLVAALAAVRDTITQLDSTASGLLRDRK